MSTFRVLTLVPCAAKHPHSPCPCIMYKQTTQMINMNIWYIIVELNIFYETVKLRVNFCILAGLLKTDSN